MGRRLPKAVTGGLASAVMVLSFLLAVMQVWSLAAMPPESRQINQTLFTWFTAGDFSVDLALRLDALSAVMILVITGIGSLIHIYSTAYMHEETDEAFGRFFSYLNLFCFFMLMLVLGSNVLVMFVGWEGVGLCSYLLIGFYYEKKSASDAAKKAFVVNRIGDFAFLLGALLLVVTFNSLDFTTIALAAKEMPVEVTFGTISLITLLMFIGATGKSAQIPLYVWLPDAMEGPTPVSALIHAATMVTAGVYMIGRNAVLFEHAPITLQVVAVVGAATALMAGTIGLVQTDIKRVLAYSTVSQLGYMFLAMGMGAFGAGIFHLMTHAFFKACLFLGSGAVIHALHGEQDIRKMGGLKKHIPITYWTFVIASVAIAGVPGLAGFFSKDEILYKTFSSGHTLLWVVGVLTSLMTATYMFRLVFLTFFGERRHAPAAAHAGHGHAAQFAIGVDRHRVAHRLEHREIGRRVGVRIGRREVDPVANRERADCLGLRRPVGVERDLAGVAARRVDLGARGDRPVGPEEAGERVDDLLGRRRHDVDAPALLMVEPDEPERLVVHDRFDHLGQGVDHERAQARLVPPAGHAERRLADLGHAPVVGAEHAEHHLADRGAGEHAPRDEPFAVQRGAVREERRLRDHGLVEVEEGGLHDPRS